MKKMISITLLVIIYIVLYAWMNMYKSKSHNTVAEGADSYSVTPPDALMYVYKAVFIVGIVLAIVFGFTYIKNTAGSTIGHVILAFTVAAIGLIVMFICVRWKIDVAGEEFTIHYAFKPAKTYTFQEIDRVEIGTKGEMVVYVDGKKVRTIDALVTNREVIEEKFESEDKIAE